jgi:hypothetical protein
MTEREIQLLGFKKQFEEDTEHPFYYYTLDIANGLSFISSANDEVKNGEWFVEFFDTDPAVRYTNFTELQALLNNLKKHLV